MTLLVIGSSQLHAQSSHISTPTASSNVLVSGTHVFNGASIVVSAPTGGFLMAFDAASVPANGVVSPDGCWLVPATPVGALASMSALALTPQPTIGFTGLTLVFSTGADCFHLVATGGAYIALLYS